MKLSDCIKAGGGKSATVFKVEYMLTLRLSFSGAGI